MANPSTNNNEKPLSPPIAQTAALFAAGGNISNELAAELLKALRTQNAENEKKEAEFATRLAYEKNHKLQLARQIDAERAKNMRLQSECMHTYKGNTLLAAIGTWDSHIPFYCCQACGKEWHKEHPPGHLIPDRERIGRPQAS
jgi:rubrerythrin